MVSTEFSCRNTVSHSQKQIKAVQHEHTNRDGTDPMCNVLGIFYSEKYKLKVSKTRKF
jgi:hypothetical protein